MKQITINIPDNKFNFVMELFNNIDFIEVNQEHIEEIPESHKNIVRERVNKSNDDPSRLLSWDEAKLKLKV